MVKILLNDARNIKRIAHYIAQKKIAVMPYGKKERRLLAMVGLADQEIVERMKKIKKRSVSEGVAISGIPEVVPLVAKLDKTPALARAARMLKISPFEVVRRCFGVGGVGLVLMALPGVPEGATMKNRRGERTVLIAGEETDEAYDIFPRVYKYLIKKFGKVMVGTSANLHGEETYHLGEQDEALDKLKDQVDLFVRDPLKTGFFPLFKHRTSTTIIDLTGSRARVLRWGSIHPSRFKKIFPDLVFEPRSLKKYQGRERLHHLLLKRIMF